MSKLFGTVNHLGGDQPNWPIVTVKADPGLVVLDIHDTSTDFHVPLTPDTAARLASLLTLAAQNARQQAEAALKSLKLDDLDQP